MCMLEREKERKKGYVQLNWRVEQLSERTLTHHCKGGIVSAFSFVSRCLQNGSILKTCCFSNLLYVLVMSEPVCPNDCSVEVPLCYCLANLCTEFILASVHLPPFQLQQKIKFVSLSLDALLCIWPQVTGGKQSCRLYQVKPFIQVMLIWELVRSKNLFIICAAASQVSFVSADFSQQERILSLFSPFINYYLSQVVSCHIHQYKRFQLFQAFKLLVQWVRDIVDFGFVSSSPALVQEVNPLQSF